MIETTEYQSIESSPYFSITLGMIILFGFILCICITNTHGKKTKKTQLRSHSKSF